MATVPPPPPGTVPVTAAGTPATAGGSPMYVTSSAAPGATRYDSDSGPHKSSEIKLISHSPLFYWWPVWAVAFLMAFVTLLENNRLAVVPPGTKVVKIDDANPDAKGGRYEFIVPERKEPNPVIRQARFADYDAQQGLNDEPVFTRRISGESWPGAIFIVTLVLTIIITTVPLRGLWSFLVIVMVIALALLFALLNIWERIFDLLGNLHIHINMAGYVTLGAILFTIWGLATFLFDRRTFVIFTPGQIRVCEHIGDSVQSYPTATVVLEKQRDDLFRHYIYGLGSGDLIIKVGGAEKREIRMPNILFLGFRLARVEDMLRTVATT